MPTFSSSVNSLRSSEIRDLMSLATKPGIISFAGGMPDNDLFPIEIIDEIYNNLSVKEKQAAMQYGPTNGLPTLLESVGEYLEKKGLPVKENKLLITTGSLQAINILAKAFIDPGDKILVENPTFIGAISAFKSYQADINSVPLLENGISVEQLRESLNTKGKKPKFLYVAPNFHNPAGTLYSADVKKQIMEMFNGIDIPIIEDDCYSALSFYEEDKVHLKTMKANNPAGIDICYLSSFSKILGPGLRLGWMLVPDNIYKKCELIKQSFDACSPSFTQVIADKFLRSGAVYKYIEAVTPEYKKRALAMLDALDKYFPSCTSWTKPRGGFYLWVQLPEGTDSTEILKRAIDKGAVFVSGKTFDPAASKNDTMRISYCNTSVEKINTGIPMIAEAIKEVCG
jgi:2-aminoadipate transaminase